MAHGQFYHYETYGRGISKAKMKKNSSLYSILGEAFREPEFSSHVDRNDTESYPPKIIYGMEFNEKISENEKLKIQKEKLIEMAEKYAKEKNLRKVDGCLMAGVVSYPPGTTLEMLHDFQKNYVMPFLLKKWKNNLRCVATHYDEFFWDDEEKKKEPHYQDHFFIIMDADEEERLTSLHAGVVAKRRAIAKKADKDGKKHSDRCYREAMSKEQDEFFAEVGERAGWKRTTVNGVRYTREEVKKWKINQKENEQKNIEIKNNIQKDCDILIKKTEEECSNITTKAVNKANEIISNAESSALLIKNEAEKAAVLLKENILNDVNKAKEEADNIIKKAEERAKDIRNSAWLSASSIVKSAEKKSNSIIDNARGFVNLFLEKVEKLPGGKRIVNWAMTFMKTKPVSKKENIHNSTNNKKKSHGRV